MSNTFGSILRVTTFGESHGTAIGALIDGCPAGLALQEADIQTWLDRRRPGQSDLTTARKEADRVVIQSGVIDGRTLGTPISLVVANTDARPSDYSKLTNIPRPSHADFTYRAKYGHQAPSGGGRASARETVARVAAGAIAAKLLQEQFGVDIVAWVAAVGQVDGPMFDFEQTNIWTREQVDQSAVRCPDPDVAAAMIKAIDEAKKQQDSLGAVVCCACTGVPPGWGEPVFDKLEAKLGQAMLSIPAAKGFDIGSGFAGVRARGSEQNDVFVLKDSGLGTRTNHSGGVQGGISNGEQILFRVAFKPPATIGKEQLTADYEGKEVKLAAKGRHDPCIAPRAVPIVEAMAALVLGDLALRQQAAMRRKDDQADA